MSSATAPKHCLVALVAALLVTAGARAGDPIPEIDVVLEQIPGGVALECTPPKCPDKWVIDLTKDFAGAMRPVNLPEGWSFAADGKQVVLEGPAPDRPTRFRFDAGEAKRPEKISYRASRDGRTLVDTKNLKVTPVAPRQQIGSLQGIVTMPTQVAPGEPMKMQVSEAANLPAGGTWSLSGTVVDEQDREDPEGMESGEPKRRVALAVAAGHEVPDRALEEIAAVLAAQGASEGTWDVVALDRDAALDEATAELWTVERGGGSSPTQSTVRKARHDTAVGLIRSIKASAAPAAGGSRVAATRAGVSSGVALYSVRPVNAVEAAQDPVMVATGIREIGEEEQDPDDPDLPDIELPDLNSPNGEKPPPWDHPMGAKQGDEEDPEDPSALCSARGGTWVETKMGGFCFEKLESLPTCLEPIPQDSLDAMDPKINWELLCPQQTIRRVEGASDDAGTGVLHYFDVTGDPALDGTTTLFVGISTSRSNLKNTSIASADPDGTVRFDRLPADLQPGSPISMQYVDKFGDALVDVPSVPDVEVVEPRGDGEARITDATPRSFAGQSVCVCGSFPGEAAWNGLLLDGQGAGSPGSASGQMVWVQLPAGLAPGEHVFTGTAAAGFPAADRASTLVLQVGGEIDSSKLQRLETTPMRLWVIGTEEPVDLRVRNLTPAIISIDGGPDQTIRTSGGARNALERSVKGLSPGAFDIKYELAGEGCPCESKTHYW
jgi:hypothetical protein